MNTKAQTCNNASLPPMSRRAALTQMGAGFGGIALAGLLAEEATASDPLAPRKPHFSPSAKNVIMLFMDGAPSHHDLFDYKPALEKYHGQPFPGKLPRVLSNTDRLGNVLKPLRPFKRRGEGGMWISDFFPHLAEVADELCLINSMHCSNPQHGAALLEWHTGHPTFVWPSMGSWILYGLGTENKNLPGYITICQPLVQAGADMFGSAILPAVYQGTQLGYGKSKAKEAKFPFIANKKVHRIRQRMELELLRELDESHLDQHGPSSELEARIRSFELAFNMQTEAPEVQDLSGESEATRELYGINDRRTEDFGRQCLLARRFVEKGVRFVQCNMGGWDHHYDLSTGLPKLTGNSDKPIAGLLKDLRQRGMLDDTLVIWGGEFGRTPMAEGGDGRDHNPYGYTMWLAGGGVKGGLTYGKTDEFGFHAIEDKMHVRDMHATILHLLGLDHEKLSYPYAGLDVRLTGVIPARVAHDVIA
jgi:Protein of unknown function (DUF1501)